MVCTPLLIIHCQQDLNLRSPTFVSITKYVGGAVVQQVERWTCDQQVQILLGATLCLTTVHVVHTYVPLSPSSITRWCSAARKVTAGLAESNDSLPPGGWLKVTCGWLPVHRAQCSVSSMGNLYLLPFTKYARRWMATALRDTRDCLDCLLWFSMERDRRPAARLVVCGAEISMQLP